MTSRLTVVALVVAFAGCGGAGPKGASGPTGPTGPTGPMGTNGMDFMAGPSISLVTPNKLVVGHSTEVAISGFATKWTANSLVSFGAGVTVSNVRVASPTAIVAVITADSSATLGTRDVTVSGGGVAASYNGVFAVLPLYAVTLPTKATLGAVFAIRIHHNDSAFSWETSPAITLTPTPVLTDVRSFVSSATPQDQVVLFFADLDAPLGKRTVHIVNNAGASTELSISLPDAFDLADKEVLPLTEGTPATGNLVDANSGVLFKYVPAIAALKIFAMGTGPTGKSTIILLTSSGKYVDAMQVGATVLGTCPPVDGCYISAYDTSGKAGLVFSMAVTAPPGGPEVEPNDTLGTAQPVTLGLIGNNLETFVTSAALGSLTDQDWYKVTVTAAEVGKKFHVITRPGDVLADPVVDVQSSTGVSLGGPSSDTGYHEDFLSSGIPAAGDYLIKVYNSTFVSSYDITRSHYLLSISVE